MDRELNKWYEYYFKKCGIPKSTVVDYTSIIKHLDDANNKNFEYRFENFINENKIAKLNEEFKNIIRERGLKVQYITIK